MLLAIHIDFFVKSMDRTVTASGGNMYQPQLLKPIQLKFFRTLTYTVTELLVPGDQTSLF